ncbi:MAG: hypothetical protein HRT34_08215, partial [Alcanivorax sp.]|nr:hypothetical protein [Alcanivorax sp.]
NIDDNGEEFRGCEDQEDEHNERLEAVFELLGERQRICGDAYPFSLDASGSVLRAVEIEGHASRELYLYFLGATRINMRTNKMLEGVDGALLMEEVCCEAIKHYLGPDRAESIILGTASSGGFKERVDQLVKSIQEPCSFQNINGEEAPVRAQDDGVDVIGWLPFADGAPGKLAIFAQVKTGTSWRENVLECQPENFQKKWLNGALTVSPVRAFCVAEAVGRTGHWNSTCCDAGVLLDRCRLVSCCVIDGFSRLNDLRNWVSGAKGLISERFPA